MKKIGLLFSAIVGLLQALWAREKPNFVVIVTDDQTYESVHALNNKAIRTPNMDRLVKNGTSFLQAFNQGSWTGAVSVASRTMLITGQNVVNAQKNSAYIVNWARTVPLESGTRVKLWGEVMEEAGYETFITGKWHNTDEPLLKSFQQGKAIAEGFYETTDEQGSKEFAYNRPNGSEWTPWNQTYMGHWSPRVRDMVVTNGEKALTAKMQVEKHTSELFADKAVEFLSGDREMPFFMYVAFNAPHDPRQSPRDFVDAYPLSEVAVPVNFLPDHPFDIGVVGERDELLSPYPRTPEGIQLHRQEYYAIISHLDRELGRILDAIEASGHGKDTYVIFTSDQGLAVGMHGLMGKQNLYDHSVRVPLIINGPDIKKDYRVNDMVYMQSIFPTTCELAGLDIPETVDYKSLIPLLKGKQNRGEKYIFGYFRHIHRMIRSDRYKLIVYPVARKLQLFDLKKDPYETSNLIADPKYAKIKDKMFKALLEKQQELGDDVVIDAAILDEIPDGR